MSVFDVIGIGFIFLGLFFAFFGSIGYLRFPDVYSRLQASSKCVTTAVVSVFIGLALIEGLSYITARLLVIGIFLFVTSPVSSHIIAKSAYECKTDIYIKEKK